MMRYTNSHFQPVKNYRNDMKYAVTIANNKLINLPDEGKQAIIRYTDSHY